LSSLVCISIYNCDNSIFILISSNNTESEMNYLCLTIFIVFIFKIEVASQKSNEWKLSRYEKGVKIHLRDGKNGGGKEVLGITTIQASLSALVFIVKDSENHYQWIYANKNAKLLKAINNFEWIYYNESKAPWPVSNRDLITHAKMKQDSISLAVTIDSQGLPNYLPAKEGIVRIKKLHSVWVFTPREHGLVDVQFELEIDLGGNIPTWLVNTSIDKGPMHTLQNMALVLQQEKYRKIRLPYIKEKK
jgi:hypothetical protein